MALALFLPGVNTTNSLASQRVFREGLNLLDAYNDTEFRSRYWITRLSKSKKILSFILKLRKPKHFYLTWLREY